MGTFLLSVAFTYQEVAHLIPHTIDELDESSNVAFAANLLDDLTKNEGLVKFRCGGGVLENLALSELAVLLISNVTVASLATAAENIIFSGLEVLREKEHLF